MSQDKSSTDSQRHKLKDIVEKSKGSVKDMIAAAYELAEEDPRGTMELVDPPVTINMKPRPPAVLAKSGKSSNGKPAAKVKKNTKN